MVSKSSIEKQGKKHQSLVPHNSSKQASKQTEGDAEGAEATEPAAVVAVVAAESTVHKVQSVSQVVGRSNEPWIHAMLCRACRPPEQIELG